VWLWEGSLRPEPGETIADAAREAIKICRIYGARYSVHQYFDLVFNGQTIRMFAHSTAEDVVAQYRMGMEKGDANDPPRA